MSKTSPGVKQSLLFIHIIIELWRRKVYWKGRSTV